MLMLVLAVLITGVLTMAVSTRNLSASRHEYTEALYVAEAGINRVIATWRGSASLPAVPGYADGTITNSGRTGAYHVSWDYWRPHGDDSLIRQDVVVLTSRGTVNTALSDKTIYNLTRTVQVNFDANGDWAWNHVYTSHDVDRPEYLLGINDFAEINGHPSVVPSDLMDENGPAMSPSLPSPKWNEWEATAKSYDTLPYANIFNAKAAAELNRHLYWEGQSTSAHTGSGHTDYNYFDPLDPRYGFVGPSYPEAYGCTGFTVTFNKQTSAAYTGVYFVHGDVIIKNGVTINGTIVATGSILFQGQASSITPEPTGGDYCAPYTVYPALIAGNNITIKDASADHVKGIMWAGRSFVANAASVYGCVVAPSVTIGGTSDWTRYGFDNPIPDADCTRYLPGESPPPMFNEPDMGALQPVPHSWREL
jgi:hypothetical protein